MCVCNVRDFGFAILNQLPKSDLLHKNCDLPKKKQKREDRSEGGVVLNDRFF